MKTIFTRKEIFINPEDKKERPEVLIPTIEGVCILYFEEDRKEIKRMIRQYRRDNYFYELLVRLDEKSNEDLSMRNELKQTKIPYKRFYSDFRGLTGTTIGDYVILLRVYKAAYLLFNSRISIEHIAYDCGFSTLSNFRRAVKKCFGMSSKELAVSCQLTAKQTLFLN